MCSLMQTGKLQAPVVNMEQLLKNNMHAVECVVSMYMYYLLKGIHIYFLYVNEKVN